MPKTYSTYALYAGDCGGMLGEAEYTAFAARAAAQIDRRTFGRARNAAPEMADALAWCECELVDALHGFAQVPFGVENLDNDGLRMGFGGNAEAACAAICRRWLAQPVNLLYAGTDVAGGHVSASSGSQSEHCEPDTRRAECEARTGTDVAGGHASASSGSLSEHCEPDTRRAECEARTGTDVTGGHASASSGSQSEHCEPDTQRAECEARTGTDVAGGKT